MLYADDFAAEQADETDGAAELKNNIVLGEGAMGEEALLHLVAAGADVIFHQRRKLADVKSDAFELHSLQARQDELEEQARGQVLPESSDRAVGKGGGVHGRADFRRRGRAPSGDGCGECG